MTVLFRAPVFLALCLSSVLFAQAHQRRSEPQARISGVYESLRVGKESGDLEGARLIITEGDGGYYAQV